MTISIIGAGAAGCFAAIHAKRLLPEADVHIYESMNRPLAKVAITGGGRCNLTNTFAQAGSMAQVYPRGTRLMQRLLHAFDHNATMRWFEAEGVRLTVQEDECVFPASQRAQEIVGTLTRLIRHLGIGLHTGHRLQAIIPEDGGYRLQFAAPEVPDVVSDIVVVATGGAARPSSLVPFGRLSLDVESPVPSLFPFMTGSDGITAMTGTVVPEVTAFIPGTRFRATGPLLITHWGLSGPAILRLSSYAARHLHDCGYSGVSLAINFLGTANEEEARTMLCQMAARNTDKQVGSVWPEALVRRLWHHLLERHGFDVRMRWSQIGPRRLNALAARLTACPFTITGRSPYKEEFVTCGGISLSNVNASTLECRHHPGLYFAGEILDVDAVTGGFNLQAAWTMGHAVAQAIARRG